MIITTYIALILGLIGASLIAISSFKIYMLISFRYEPIFINLGVNLISISAAFLTFSYGISESRRENESKDIISIKSSISSMMYGNLIRGVKITTIQEEVDKQIIKCNEILNENNYYDIYNFTFQSLVYSNILTTLTPGESFNNIQIQDLNTKFGEVITGIAIGNSQDLIQLKATASAIGSIVLDTLRETDAKSMANKICGIQKAIRKMTMMLLANNGRGISNFCAIGAVIGDLNLEEHLRKIWALKPDDKSNLSDLMRNNKKFFSSLFFSGKNCFAIVDHEKFDILEKAILKYE